MKLFRSWRVICLQAQVLRTGKRKVISRMTNGGERDSNFSRYPSCYYSPSPSPFRPALEQPSKTVRYRFLPLQGDRVCEPNHPASHSSMLGQSLTLRSEIGLN